LRQGLAICERDGIVGTRGYILSNLTELALRAGDLAAAESHAGHAIEVATASGNRAVLSWVKSKVARLAVRLGDNDAARSALAEGLSVALELGSPGLKFDAVESFAELLSAQGEVSCARRVLTYAADHPTASALVRDEIRRRLETLPAAVNATPPWPKLELDDLLHRIVVESNVAHAPLIDTLRGAQ
jgi:ATP/maltotriose-dependent transcriptional regulator MalT